MARIFDHSAKHLAVASEGHGVFKGVRKCRIFPREERKKKTLLRVCQAVAICSYSSQGVVGCGRRKVAVWQFGGFLVYFEFADSEIGAKFENCFVGLVICAPKREDE